MVETAQNQLASMLPHLAVSAVLFAALLMLVDANAVFSAIASSNPLLFLLAFLFYGAINFLMAFRVHTLLAAMNSHVKFARVLSCHYLGMLASDFTPARSGYFATAFALNSHKVPLSRAVSAILGPQLFDFMLKAGVSAVGLAFLATTLGLSNGMLLPAIIAIFVILGFIFTIVSLLFFPSLSAPFLPLLKKLPFGSKIHYMATKLQINAPLMRSNLPLILSILAMSWLFKGFEWWVLAEAVGMQANLPIHPLLFFLMLQPLATLLQFIPTPTPAGAGLSEAGIVGVMVLLGANPAIAAAFGIMTRAVMISQNWLGVFEWRSLKLDFVDEENW